MKYIYHVRLKTHNTKVHDDFFIFFKFCHYTYMYTKKKNSVQNHKSQTQNQKDVVTSMY